MARTTSLPRIASPSDGGAGQGVVSVLFGAAFTLALFLGIARFDRTATGGAPATIMDLRMVSVQEPPPPPRETPREQTPVEMPRLGIDAVRSDSPVQIAVAPPDLIDFLPPQVAPPAVIQLGQLYSSMKPKIDISAMSDHIYQMMEVDQVPRVLHRVSPSIPPSVRRNVTTLRTSLLFVVDVNGEIRNVRIASTSGNADFDAIILAMGAEHPRDLSVPGRELKGVHFAMDFLPQQNKRGYGEDVPDQILATGKRVIIIGGGDTGADCLGTSHRQKAASVHQFEIMPMPPESRHASTPWPLWPLQLRTESAHEEGGMRDWALNTARFTGDENGNAQMRQQHAVVTARNRAQLGGKTASTARAQQRHELVEGSRRMPDGEERKRHLISCT